MPLTSRASISAMSDSSPCKNGGVCLNKEDSFVCECEEYCYGETCEGMLFQMLSKFFIFI